MRTSPRFTRTIRSGGGTSAPISTTTTSPIRNRVISGPKTTLTIVAPVPAARARWSIPAQAHQAPNAFGPFVRSNVSVPTTPRKLDGAMIPPTVVAEVKRLLTQPGLSQRKVAAITGVSRASVSAIAAGRRPDYPSRCNPHDEEDLPQGPVGRCATCGGMVYMPCRLCRVRSIKAKERERFRRRSACDPTWALGRAGS